MHLLATAAQASPYQIRLSSLIVMFVVGTLLPLLVGFVTKWDAHPGLKGFLLITFTAVSALIVQSTMNDGVAVISKQGAALAFFGWVQAVASHFGIWSPSGVSARLAPTVGIGGTPAPRRVPAA